MIVSPQPFLFFRDAGDIECQYIAALETSLSEDTKLLGRFKNIFLCFFESSVVKLHLKDHRGYEYGDS